MKIQIRLSAPHSQADQPNAVLVQVNSGQEQVQVQIDQNENNSKWKPLELIELEVLMRPA